MSYSKSFRVVQTFGAEGVNYKLLLKSPRNGARFVIIYGYQIGARPGDEAIVQFDYMDRFEKISIPRTGSWSSIVEANKVG